MTDLKHDPDFPYVVLIREDHRPDYILGKFSDIAYAIQLKNVGIASFREIVDTTPKPKIPEDAEFVYYTKSGYDFYVRQLEDGNWKTDGGVLYSYAEILDVLEDAEVTVLVRKEES